MMSLPVWLPDAILLLGSIWFSLTIGPAQTLSAGLPTSTGEWVSLKGHLV